MALEIVQYGALKDNYNYLLYDKTTGKVAVVDPSEAAPTIEHLEQRGWSLDIILNTHHHWDHTDGNAPLKARFGAEIYGYAGDATRIAGIDRRVTEGDEIQIGASVAQVLFVPGHTTGHIAYYFADDKALFCGDTLFLMGCGRLFEGTAEQMFASFQKLAALPDDTRIFCGHEYTQTNAEFSLTIEPENEALQARMEQVRVLRQQNKPTVPATLGEEKATNPFMRAKNVQEFARIRTLKDQY